MILDSDLYERILIDPARTNGVDKLTIVSGYATASMLSIHEADLSQLELNIKIDLTIGMTPSDGIVTAQHDVFKKMQVAKSNINCRYLVGDKSVHSKVYVWSRNNDPLVAFAGSANYSYRGFRSKKRVETMSEVDPKSAYAFCKRIRRKSVICLSDAIDTSIAIHVPNGALPKSLVPKRKLNTVKLPLVVKTSGETHQKSGLNWGQRAGRESNQAYIPIPSAIYKSEFFPPIGDRFVMQTDDGISLIFTRAQERGKALHTPDDNSIIGRYFRRRLKVPSGDRVLRKHLNQYGRTDVLVTKTDDETYFLDFSQ